MIHSMLDRKILLWRKIKWEADRKNHVGLGLGFHCEAVWSGQAFVWWNLRKVKEWPGWLSEQRAFPGGKKAKARPGDEFPVLEDEQWGGQHDLSTWNERIRGQRNKRNRSCRALQIMSWILAHTLSEVGSSVVWNTLFQWDYSLSCVKQKRRPWLQGYCNNPGRDDPTWASVGAVESVESHCIHFWSSNQNSFHSVGLEILVFRPIEIYSVSDSSFPGILYMLFLIEAGCNLSLWINIQMSH